MFGNGMRGILRNSKLPLLLKSALDSLNNINSSDLKERFMSVVSPLGIA